MLVYSTVLRKLRINSICIFWQYNPMLTYVYLCRLHGQCLRNDKAKMCLGEITVWKQVRTASENCKLFCHLAAYAAHTAALVCYAKDKEAFMTAKSKGRQIIYLWACDTASMDTNITSAPSAWRCPSQPQFHHRACT